MSVATAYSTSRSPEQAAAEVRETLVGIDPTLVVFFASPKYNAAGIARAMADAFLGAKVIGATTAGEMTSGRMLKDSLVAMAFDAGHIPSASVQVVTGLSAGVDVNAAFDGFAQDLGFRMSAADPAKYVGLVLVDGLSGAEEQLMEAVGNHTNVFFVGGSAGDNLAFERTHVFADGIAYTDAAVLAVFAPAVPFEIVKTQSFMVTDKSLVATKVNEASREVIEFDNKPAAEAYAEALRIPAENAADFFMSNPVGLVAGGEPFVRSPQRVLDDGVMRFYCNIGEGMRMALLEGTDIIAETRAALDESEGRLGGLSALVTFNCILRTLELEGLGLTDEYGALFEHVPTVGFSTYGEEHIGHLNQTATILAFK